MRALQFCFNTRIRWRIIIITTYSEWKQGNSSVAKATTIHATTLTVGITTITKHDRISTFKKNSGKSRPEKKTRKQRKTSITYKKNSRIISKNAQISIKRRNVKIRRLQLNDVINMVTKLLYYMSHESNNQKINWNGFCTTKPIYNIVPYQFAWE